MGKEKGFTDSGAVKNGKEAREERGHERTRTEKEHETHDSWRSARAAGADNSRH